MPDLLQGFRTWLNPGNKRPPRHKQGKPKAPLFNLRRAGRLLYQKKLMDLIRDIEGDIVECGVGEGDSFLDWSVISFLEGPRERTIWGFDSFEGFPEPSEEDRRPAGQKEIKKNGASAPMQAALKKLTEMELPKNWLDTHTILVKGYFENSLSRYDGKGIALLHIDADLYQSYKTVLRQLYPKVVAGGIVAFDEYMSETDRLKWPGAKKAVDEYFADRNVEILRDSLHDKCYLVKP